MPDKNERSARLYPAVGVFGEAALLARVHGVVGGPRPAAELGPAVVSKGLLDFGLRVHDKRAVLCDRLAYGSALQH